MSNLQSRRSVRWAPALAFISCLLIPGSVGAVDVTFDPTQGRPAMTVAVTYECAEGPDGGHIGPPSDAVIFARRPARLDADTGYVDSGDPVLTEFPAAGLTFVGPHSIFEVPRLRPGSYYLYAQCAEQDLFIPLLPTFRVLGTPDTSTQAVGVEGRGGWFPPALALGIALAVTYALSTRRDKTRVN